MVPTGFLATRVGRQLFGRFLLAAFVPTILTAVVAFWFAKGQLRSDVERRVAHSAKRAGVSILGMLERREWLLRAAASIPGDQSTTPPPGFQAILVRPLREGVPAAHATEARRALSAAEEKQLAGGGSVVAVLSGDDGPTVLIGLVDAKDASRVRWGVLADSVIWRPILDELGTDGASLCVIESGSGTPLQCEDPPPPEGRHRLEQVRGEGGVTLVNWTEAGRRQHSASWDVFLRYEYGAPDWRVIVTEPEAISFANARRFTTTLISILAAALLVVFFLSHTQIRRSTEPLEQLQAGTRRVAAGDFSTLVQVNAQNEFADLASSFNRMSRTLGRQITMLESLDRLNESVIGAHALPPVVDAAVSRIGDQVPDAHVLAAVEEVPGAVLSGLFRKPDGSITPVRFTLGDRHRIATIGARVPVSAETAERLFPRGLFDGVGKALHVTPLLLDQTVVGVVAIASPREDGLTNEALDTIRRLTDRLTLAIADVAHIRHLDSLSSGTLTAFARAIDANSHWTAGHSERVTGVGLVIGARLGLPQSEMGVLRRGGLLHDIGKIGVPPHILDKAGPLTPAERRVVEQHPVLGAEILTPIGTFSDAIPIVRSHHEKMDGTGYPDGLRGDAIPYLARVLAVADVFDALVSDRPYRSGMGVAKAVSIIRDGIGSHFDERVTAAFLEAVAAGEVDAFLSVERGALALANSVGIARRVIEDAA